MRKISIVWLMVSSVSALFFLVLLFELGRHDPYRWLTPSVDSLESRELWNERKWLYFYAMAGSFVSVLISLVFLISQKFKKKGAETR